MTVSNGPDSILVKGIKKPFSHETMGDNIKLKSWDQTPLLQHHTAILGWPNIG